MRKLKQELWPHMVTLNKAESDPELYLIEAWLEQNMGIFDNRWHIVYGTSKTDFYFKEDKDAMWFTLRWS